MRTGAMRATLAFSGLPGPCNAALAFEKGRMETWLYPPVRIFILQATSKGMIYAY